MKHFPSDPTRQRRHVAFKRSVGGRVHLKADNPAVVKGRSIFHRTRVFHASVLPRLLKSGANSRKTGSRVLKGRWAGMPIYTLTLEERATCPRTCLQWSSCFGSNMQYAERIIADEVFENRLWAELEMLNGKHAAGYVVRLHILGDFYSVDYVAIWEAALVHFPALRVFGYTARLPNTEIGAALMAIATTRWDRFAMRFSGADIPKLASLVVDHAEEATSTICPAQLRETKNQSCASCSFCWESRANITFLRH
jgi:hypothetical protein